MKIQIFCFTYAGGNSNIFAKLEPYLNKDISLVKIEYSGHGTRKTEELITCWKTFLEDVAIQVNEQADPSALPIFMGYSMGSIVAYELIIQKMTSVVPLYFIGAAHETPDSDWESKSYWKLDDATFLETMISFGGIDSRLLDNPRFLNIFLAPLKADYFLLGTYSSQHTEQLDCPICLFYSEQDTTFSAVSGWNRFTNKEIEFVELGHNHFFIKDYADVMAEKINQIGMEILYGY